jgi:hypothetical protein
MTALPAALDAARPAGSRVRSTTVAGRKPVRRVARWWRTVRDRVATAGRDRGDVPGWVLVTLMTAGLVLALWALAGPALTAVFSDSIARVTGAIG